MTELVLVKLGGSALNGECGEVLDELVALHRGGTPVVLVHGGGPEISRMLEALGRRAHFVEGQRVTDEGAMEVVEMVLGGRINKSLVARLQGLGVACAGLSGIDGRTLQVQPMQGGRLGRVGEVVTVDPKLILGLLRDGYLPVVAPMGIGADSLSYNVNGDMAAGALARALQARRLVFVSDVPGVLDAERQLLSQLNLAEAERLLQSEAVSGGMIPKIQSALLALRGGVPEVDIGTRIAGSGTRMMA